MFVFAACIHICYAEEVIEPNKDESEDNPIYDIDFGIHGRTLWELGTKWRGFIRYPESTGSSRTGVSL